MISWDIQTLNDLSLPLLLMLVATIIVFVVGIFILIRQRKIIQKLKTQVDILERELTTQPPRKNAHLSAINNHLGGTVFDRFAKKSEEAPEPFLKAVSGFGRPQKPHKTSTSAHSPAFTYRQIQMHPKAEHIILLHLQNHGGAGRIVDLISGKYNESVVAIHQNGNSKTKALQGSDTIAFHITGKEGMLPTYHFILQVLDASGNRIEVEISGWGGEQPMLQTNQLTAFNHGTQTSASMKTPYH